MGTTLDTHIGGKRKLYRSRDGYIGGVCAGVADNLNLEPILVRILALLIAITTFSVGILIYAVMWIALPLEPSVYTPFDVEPEHVESSTYGDVDASQARGVVFGQLSSVSHEEGMNTPIRLIMAIALLLLFGILARTLTPFVKGTYWWQYWPLALIITGFALMVIPIARERTSYWHLSGAALIILGWFLTPVSIGFLSPLTFVYAFKSLWLLLIAAVLLFAVSVYRDLAPLAVIAIILFAAFCLISITEYAVPGTMGDLIFVLPDGSSRLLLRIPRL